MTDFNWSNVSVREIKLPGKQRKSGFLHIDDLAWVQRAFKAMGSKQQFAFALLLYRHCRMHKSKGAIAGVRAIAADWGISHDAAARAVRRLTAAGLIEAHRIAGSSYRVQLVPTRTGKLRGAA